MTNKPKYTRTSPRVTFRLSHEQKALFATNSAKYIKILRDAIEADFEAKAEDDDA